MVPLLRGTLDPLLSSLSLPNFKEYVFTNVDFFISKTLSRRGRKIWHQWQRQMTDKSRLHGLILAFCEINVLSLKQNTSSWFLLGFLFFFTPRQWSCGLREGKGGTYHTGMLSCSSKIVSILTLHSTSTTHRIATAIFRKNNMFPHWQQCLHTLPVEWKDGETCYF